MVKLYIKDLQSAWLRGSTGEQRASIREHRESRWTKLALAREQSSLLVNDGSCAIQFEDYYIYIIYTPNLGLEIAVSVREREQGRFRESIGGARRSTGEHRGSTILCQRRDLSWCQIINSV